MERIEQDSTIHLPVIVVPEAQRGVRKSETVHFVHIAEANHFSRVAVRHESHGHALAFWQSFGGFHRPIVIVLHRHDQITAVQHLIALENARSNAIVEDIRPLVRSGHDDGFARAPFAITLLERIDQFVAGHELHLGVVLRFDERKARLIHIAFEIEVVCRRQRRTGERTDLTTQARRVAKYRRSRGLSHHIGEFAPTHMEAVPLEHPLLQRRALVFAHRRQLCRVAYHHQAAILSTIYILYQIVEQTSRTEERVTAIVGHHRGLIDDEQGRFRIVPSAIELGILALE